MRTPLVLSLLLVGLTACTADSDGDGILDEDELRLGTDPENDDTDGDGLRDGGETHRNTDPLNPDSDGDGLLDGEEVKTYGTDPNDTDSDGDGYLDGWEVDAGSDPADAASVIYAGGWPYNPNRDSYEGLYLPRYGVGDTFPAVVMQDQHGDMVSIADFAEQGEYILIDLSAEWCPPCQNMSSWLAYGSTSYDNTFPGVLDNVEDGTVRWITILGQDYYGGDPDLEVLQSWDDRFPHELVPVLGGNAELNSAIYHGFPSFYLLDENLTILEAPGQSGTSAYWAAVTEAGRL